MVRLTTALWRISESKFKIGWRKTLQEEKSSSYTDRRHGQCKPVTRLYLYMHLLKYSTFSGISRRWRGMNFNYTWIMYAQSAFPLEHNLNTHTQSFHFFLLSWLGLNLGQSIRRNQFQWFVSSLKLWGGKGNKSKGSYPFPLKCRCIHIVQ